MGLTFATLQDKLALNKMKNASGAAVIDQAMLQDDPLTRLLTQSGFFPGGKLTIANAQSGDGNGQNNQVVIKGQTTFPGEGLQISSQKPGGQGKKVMIMAPGKLDVVATFALKGDGTLISTLRFALPPGWHFADTFPDLPSQFDQTQPDQPTTLNLTERFFYLTTHAHQAAGVDLQAGLNLVSRWSPKGALSVLEHWLGDGHDPVTLGGPIIHQFPAGKEGKPQTAAEALPPVPLYAYPWGTYPPAKDNKPPPPPGITLQASLGLEATLGDQITFTVKEARLYSPVSKEWLVDAPDHDYSLVYLGEIVIPSLVAGTREVDMWLAAEEWPGRGGEMLLSGEFDGLDLENMVDALADVIGGADAIQMIPAEVRSALGQVSLRNMALKLSTQNGSYQVDFAAVTIGLTDSQDKTRPLEWTAIEKILVLGLRSIRVMVQNPFDGTRRALSAVISGELILFEVELDVTVGMPDGTIEAVQNKSTPILLSKFAKEYFPTLPPPPDIKIDNIRIEAVPSTGYYSFAMRLAAGEAWLDEEGDTAQPELDITFTDTGWQLEGAAASEDGLPIALLINKLAEVGGFKDLNLPAALDKIKILFFSVSYDTPSKDFKFSSEAKFTLFDPPMDAGVTIESMQQSAEVYSKHFGGYLAFDVGKSQLLRFELTYDSDPKSSTFMAAYQDDFGEQIEVDDLLKTVIKGTDIKTGLSFTLKDALLVYRSDQAESLVLFGLDIDGGLNLSDLKLPSLPLIDWQPLPPDQTLKLSLQVVVASRAVKADEIQQLSALQQGGLKLPAQDIKELSLAAMLHLGDKTVQLSLSLGFNQTADKPAPAQQPANGSAASPPNNGLVPAGQATVSAARPASGSNVTANDGTQWIKIQKSFGPVAFERVGVAFANSKITALLDAAISVGGLTLSLDGLSMSSPITAFEPQFSLSGLGIDFSNGPVEVGGSLLMLKDKNGQITGFAGLATVRTAKLSLAAIGSFTQTSGSPSLFIYVVADYPLGGPAFFFVTGFAAGLGYNRRLVVPPIEEVATFPLVAEAMKPAGPAPLPTDQAGRQNTLSTKLQSLEKYIPSSIGDYFIAAGIKFTTFKLLDSFALLVIQFGNRFEIDLLGLSTLVAPLPDAGSTVPPMAVVHMALKASFVPAEGYLEIRAALTPDSYIISKDCHLTGGFAFFAWFDPNPHAGDFVITLGGYHPLFVVPDHYPKVPRLALNWQVSDLLQVKAEAYFALTSSAIMAGGLLQATWHSGDLRAWFNAGADFLIAWKPYHYDIKVYVDIGASYTLGLGDLKSTISIEVGADVHLWGPEFSGTTTVHLYIVSFSVEFGAGGSQSMAPIAWDQFKTSFLPADDKVCSINVQQGLVRQMNEGEKNVRWIVNPKEMVLGVSSAIPINSASATAAVGGNRSLDLQNANTQFGVASVGVEPGGTVEDRFASDYTISINHDRKGVVTQEFTCTPVLKPAPAALWGIPHFDPNDKTLLNPPNLHGDRLVDDTVSGFEIRPTAEPEAGLTQWLSKAELQYSLERSAVAFSWQDSQLKDMPGQAAWESARQTIITANDKRAELLAALGFVNPLIDLGEPVMDDVLLPA